MLKRAASAWGTFWIGVVIALIFLATVGWQAALVVFAIALALTIIQVLLALKKGVKAFNDFGNSPSRRPPGF